MANLGLTETLGNGWLDTIRGNPFVIGIAALQFYVGLPGADGTSNLSTVTGRTAVNFDTPADAQMLMTGDPPEFDVTGAATLQYAGGVTGLDGDDDAWVWATGQLTVATVVADGDTVLAASVTVKFKEKAED